MPVTTRDHTGSSGTHPWQGHAMALREIKVGVRELKACLSEHLRWVLDWAMEVIAAHGEPVGPIVLVAASRDQRVEDLLGH